MKTDLVNPPALYLALFAGSPKVLRLGTLKAKAQHGFGRKVYLWRFAGGLGAGSRPRADHRSDSRSPAASQDAADNRAHARASADGRYRAHITGGSLL